MKKPALIFFLLFLTGNIILAQVNSYAYLDTLKKDLLKQKDDTNKVNILVQLSQEYAFVANMPDQGLIFANQALELEKQFGNKKRLAYIYRRTGNIYFERYSNYEKALEYYFESLKLFQEANDQMGMAACFNNIGNIYSTKGSLSGDTSDFNTSLRYLNKGLMLRKKYADSGSVGASYLNIGSTYLAMHSYDKATECLLKSSKLYEKLGEPNGITLSYTALSRAYLGKGNIKKALEYTELCNENFAKSKTKLDTMLIQRGFTDINMILGEIYLKSGDYGKSLVHLQKALELATINTYNESKEEIYSALSQLYDKKKSYKEAYQYQTRYINLKDSLLNAQAAKNLDIMQMSYEAERKEKEIISLTKENEIKNLKLNEQQLDLRKRQIEIFALIIVALLIIISSAYINNRNKAKQREKLNTAIIAQREMRSKAILATEEKERTRIAKDLHDSIGQMLSAAKLNVSQLESLSGNNEQEKKLFHNAMNLIDESCKEIRNISHNMMPSTLVKSGLAVAVSEFLDKLGQLNNLEVHFEVLNINERLDNNLEMILYRVIQESVNNILKHSDATQITLQLIKRNNELSCMIEDNGKGFDAENMENGKGIGLKNIYSRIAYLNGNVHIDSKIGRGTTINIEIPLT